ncbi:Calx-beta domain-containing protein [Kibdelosporangium lantanae]|uniref:Calx-beta domain-containing protein n=1 Tax=Kibdelosporangium lantanae TaxID=1497396 RepID=A0ABW3MEI9_9PSEU
MSLLAALAVPVSAQASPAQCSRTVSVDSIRGLEGSGDVLTTFTFKVTSDGCANEGTVAYRTVPGSAQPKLDYIPVESRLTWAKGDTSARGIDVSVIPDRNLERDETFCVELIPPADGSVVIGKDSTGVATIVDDDDQKADPPHRGFVCQQ